MFNFSAFFVYMIITAITPGPNNITSMTNAARYGFRKSWPYNLGMWVAFTIVMILCALFSTVLQTLVPTIKPYLIGAGAAYMLYLAWETWKQPSPVVEADIKAKNSGNEAQAGESSDAANGATLARDTSQKPTATDANFWKLFTSGALLQFMNPKIIIYGITSLSVYVVPVYSNRIVIALFSILLSSVGITCTVLWALLGSKLRTLFSKHTRIVNGILALLLVWCTITLFQQ